MCYSPKVHSINFVDIALKILQDYPELALTLDVDGATPLYRLAGRPALFEFENQPWFWQRWVYSSEYHFYSVPSKFLFLSQYINP